jgi:hypothetical protein
MDSISLKLSAQLIVILTLNAVKGKNLRVGYIKRDLSPFYNIKIFGAIYLIIKDTQ